MPSISSVALFSLAVLGATAAPSEKRWNNRHGGRCLSDDQAEQVADTWASLITDYSDALADATLTENFTDYSESVNTLINSCPQGDAAKPLPLLDPTFTSRDAFKLGQGQQPAINFQRLNLWHSCNAVNLRWMTTNTAPIPNPKPVVGLIALEVSKNPDWNAQYPWLINTVYSEFDAGAWLQNLVEAGICSSGAGLPGSGAANCSAPAAPEPTANSTVPATPSTPAEPYSTPEPSDDCDEE